MTGLGRGYDRAGAQRGGFRPHGRLRAFWQPYGKEVVRAYAYSRTRCQTRIWTQSGGVHWLSWPGGSSSSGHERNHTHTQSHMHIPAKSHGCAGAKHSFNTVCLHMQTHTVPHIQAWKLERKRPFRLTRTHARTRLSFYLNSGTRVW